MEQDVGFRLRLVRLRHQLSQRALAKRTGVAHATISLIESGRTSPSVSALKRILAGIPMTLGEFFSDELPPAESEIFYRAGELTEISGGEGISYRQIGSARAGHALQILFEHYDVGADTGLNMLYHEGEEGGVILSGQLEVTVGEATRVLKPGDAYYFNSRQPHRFRNVGKEPCTLVSSCSPPSF
ncbi:cupin domain-containing protein [Halothiobacillus sp.]|jgi:transcriptional regulator with XRE-family HTH domain|uniref:cupin domain-containing protein n=1 Tax=Halothiobacillus sp. TaxID=1891311 RepID=UPI00260AA9EA|nr:cupin domain-containing protein [Halothiobacillus sp.]MDD4966137.1 cupin domain-containing protein [Halothiobacillus sp.]